MCNNCDTSCFPESIKCLYHDGKSVGVISKGDSQQYINEALASKLEEISGKVGLCNKCSSATAITNSPAFQERLTSNEVYSVTSSPTTTGTLVSYDYTNAVKSLGSPTKCKVTVRKIGEGARVINQSDSLSKSLLLAPTDFPAVIDTDIRISTEDGEKLFTSTTNVVATKATDNGLLGATSNVAEPTNQEELVQYLQKRINSLENQVKESNLTTQQAKISSLESKVDALIESMK